MAVLKTFRFLHSNNSKAHKILYLGVSLLLRLSVLLYWNSICIYDCAGFSFLGGSIVMLNIFLRIPYNKSVPIRKILVIGVQFHSLKSPLLPITKVFRLDSLRSSIFMLLAVCLWLLAWFDLICSSSLKLLFKWNQTSCFKLHAIGC